MKTAMTIPHSDRLIIDEIAARRDCGFRMLLDKYMPVVYWHVRRLVVAHEDAEDVMQETFIRVYGSLGRIDSDSASLRPWILRIATNEALRHIDSMSRRPSTVLDEAATMAADTYIDYSDVEAVRLQRAIHTLPPRQQSVFNLRYYDELSYEEIADILDITADAAKSSFYLAKDKIIKSMTS